MFKRNIASLLSSKTLPVVSGNNFVFPYKSSISIFTFLGTASNPNEAIKISCICIIEDVFPFVTYVSRTFPNINPIITPIFPSLLNIPAIIPESAYVAIIIGSPLDIIPITLPIVTPAVAPTNIPFFQPNISTINMHNMFLMLNPKAYSEPKLLTAIAIRRLAPIISSIVYALFSPIFSITDIEFTNIL